MGVKTCSSLVVDPGLSIRSAGRATHQIKALDEYYESAVTNFLIGARFHAALGKTEMVNSGPFSNDLGIEIRRHQRVRETVGSRNMPSEFQELTWIWSLREDR